MRSWVAYAALANAARAEFCVDFRIDFRVDFRVEFRVEFCVEFCACARPGAVRTTLKTLLGTNKRVRSAAPRVVGGMRARCTLRCACASKTSTQGPTTMRLRARRRGGACCAFFCASDAMPEFIFVCVQAPILLYICASYARADEPDIRSCLSVSAICENTRFSDTPCSDTPFSLAREQRGSTIV